MQAIQVIRFLTLLFRRGGIRWLLRDEFDDTRASGSVNGTPATPGPGTRTVVDTAGTSLSVSGGELQFANAAVAHGNPGLWYGSVARANGRVLIMRINHLAMGVKYYGWDSNQSADIVSGSYRATTTDLQPQPPNVSASTYTIGLSTDAFVLASTGVYFFHAGTLIWHDSTSITNPVYPGFAQYAVNFSAWAVAFVRIPEELWLPTPACYDTMTRANGPMGNSETSGPDSQPVTARVWTANVGTWAIAGNVATCSALAGGLGFATVDTATANVLMQGTLTRAGNEVGLILRYVDADNYIRAIHDGTNMKLIKRVAAAETDVISAVAAIGAGAVVVVADGTAFSLYLNSVQVGATSTIADAALQTGTRQGLYSSNVGNTFDNFLVFPRGSGGEFAALNKWSQ